MYVCLCCCCCSLYCLYSLSMLLLLLFFLVGVCITCTIFFGRNYYVLKSY